MSRKWLIRAGYFGLGGLIVATCLLIATYVWLMFTYQNRIVPGMRILTMPVSGMSKEQAEAQLTSVTDKYINETFPVRLTFDKQEWQIPYEAPAVRYEVQTSVEQALAWGRSGPLKERALALYQAQKTGISLPLKFNIDKEWWDEKVASIAAEINLDPVKPELVVNGKSVTVKNGVDGRKLNEEIFLTEIQNKLASLQPLENELPVENVVVPITAQDIEATKQRAGIMLDRTLAMGLPNDFYQASKIKILGKEMVPWLNFNGGYNPQLIADYLEVLAATYNQEARDAKFHFDAETQRMTEFVPAQDGLRLNVAASQEKVIETLVKVETQNATEAAELVFDRTKPTTTLDQVNTMGIKELIGRGFSTFKGSIVTRIHNVTLAASRINGTLVKPGEVFSFNQAVGEVNGATGYQKAYIIRNGRTELDDGGGVCQVSTTVFRAALNAGLPITERRAHAYRVGYYEQNAKAGLDATVFSPTTDLKFVNDTPAYFLVQTTVDVPSRALTVEIYGTSDGRSSEIKNHVIWDITPPPPDVYQDDPTLPSGTVKQVEHSVAGAKAKFDYVVTRAGEEIYSKTFYSIFKPWANVYLRGTGT